MSKQSRYINELLRGHTVKYFSANENNPDAVSDFEMDLATMTPAERARAELALVEYNASKQKSIDMSLVIQTDKAIDQRLAELAGNIDYDNSDDDDDF